MDRRDPILSALCPFSRSIFFEKVSSMQRDHRFNRSSSINVLNDRQYWMIIEEENQKWNIYNILKMSVFTNFGHIGHLSGLKMGPIWKFSNFFSKLVISIPKTFQQGVMTLYFEKSWFWPILGHIWHLLLRPKYGPDMKIF